MQSIRCVQSRLRSKMAALPDLARTLLFTPVGVAKGGSAQGTLGRYESGFVWINYVKFRFVILHEYVECYTRPKMSYQCHGCHEDHPDREYYSGHQGRYRYCFVCRHKLGPII